MTTVVINEDFATVEPGGPEDTADLARQLLDLADDPADVQTVSTTRGIGFKVPVEVAELLELGFREPTAVEASRTTLDPTVSLVKDSGTFGRPIEVTDEEIEQAEAAREATVPALPEFPKGNVSKAEIKLFLDSQNVTYDDKDTVAQLKQRWLDHVGVTTTA